MWEGDWRGKRGWMSGYSGAPREGGMAPNAFFQCDFLLPIFFPSLAFHFFPLFCFFCKITLLASKCIHMRDWKIAIIWLVGVWKDHSKTNMID